LLQTFAGGAADVCCVDFSRDGRQIAAGSRNGTVRIWNVTTGSAVVVIETGSGMIDTMTFSLDNSVILTASARGLYAWDLPSGEPLQQLSRAFPQAIDIISEDTCLLLYHECKTIIWNWRNGSTKETNWLTPGSGYSVKVTDDKIHIKVASYFDHVFRLNVYHFESGSLLIQKEFPATIQYLDKPLIVLSKSGRYMAFHAQNLEIWDLENDVQLFSFGISPKITSIALSPDGAMVVFAEANRGFFIINCSDPDQLIHVSDKVVRCLSFSPDGEKVVSGHHEGAVRVWDLDETSLSILKFQMQSFSRDDRLLALIIAEDATQVVLKNYRSMWGVETATGKIQWQTDLTRHPVSTHDLCYSPDLTRAASLDNGTIHVWELPSMLDLTQLHVQIDVLPLMFSPKNKHFLARTLPVVASARTIVWYLRDARHGTMIYMDGQCLTVSNTYLAALKRGENTLVIWDIDQDVPVQELQHTEYIMSADFARGGERLVTASYHRTMQVWDAGSGELLQQFSPQGITKQVVYSLDQRHVACQTEQSDVYVWDGTAGTLVNVYRSRLRAHPEFSHLRLFADGTSFVTERGHCRSQSIVSPSGIPGGTDGDIILLEDWWITFESKRIFLIPLEYRASGTFLALFGNVAFFQDMDGVFTRLEFDFDKLP
jgi:WD40 repeat protein